MTQPKTTEKASAPAGERAIKTNYWVSDEETGDHLVPEKFRPLAEANEELRARLERSEARVTELRANCVRLSNYIERHHTLELDTEAALLVSEARKTVLNTGGVLQ